MADERQTGTGEEADRPDPQAANSPVDPAPDSTPEWLEEVRSLIEEEDFKALDEFLRERHPADLARAFKVLPRRLWPRLIARLDIERISDLMEELPDHLRDDLAEHLKQDQLAEAVEAMASDDAADVLADLPEPMAQLVIEALPEEEREEVENLLRYPEDTAGGLMQMELVSVPASSTVEHAVREIRAKAEDVDPFHYVYVTDDGERLVGVLNLKSLILSAPDRPIRELMNQDVHVVMPEVDQERVARLFRRYDLVALPVVDEDGRLLGRILHDDAVDVLFEEADEDAMHMAGAGAQEPELVYTNRLFKIASVRLPWLLATLAGLTVPALLVWAFQLSFPHMLALVPFIPVIGAMGGNVGTQSSTIVVRGFATGRVDMQNLGRFLTKELVVSILMGLACGVLSGVVAIAWHTDVMLSATVAISMTIAIVASALLGVLVPYFFRLIHVDPAIAAGPLVTTIDDIVAIAIYYGVALLLLSA